MQRYIAITVAACALAACGSPRHSADFVPRATSPSTAPASTTSTTGPSTTTSAARTVSCAAQNGYVAVGRRRALVRAAATDHLRAAVVVLHGYTGSPERIETTSGWTTFLHGTDVLVAYPAGTATSEGGYGWSTGSARFSTKGVDDVAFLQALLNSLEAGDCVDPRHILVTGESNGGAMTLLVGCDARTAKAAVLFAPVIPAVDQNVLNRCRTASVLPVLVVASKRDHTVDYSGHYPTGEAPLSAPEMWFDTVARSANKCSGAEIRDPVTDADHLHFVSCDAPSDFYGVTDGVHTWPGGPVGTGGLPPGRFPATRLIWCRSGLSSAPALPCGGIP